MLRCGRWRWIGAVSSRGQDSLWWLGGLHACLLLEVAHAAQPQPGHTGRTLEGAYLSQLLREDVG